VTIAISERVAGAIADGDPVVALESTIIAHGFPRPRNLEVAIGLEGAVTELGAVPATVAVVDGTVVVGLDRDELERIATKPVDKLNVSNLAVAVATGGSGATTVSATLRAAGLAGISIMATGGIGGVHRDQPSDVSSDLTEMARSRVAIVASGAKAFLDLPATLDYLETTGVTVVGYRTDTFPAFYSRSSGLSLQATVHSPGAAAAVINAARDIDGGSVFVANPVPEDAALDPDDVAEWTRHALARANEAGIAGAARSPFVLAALAELSAGQTVDANAALARANAVLAAQVAVEL
jgi:pseudouridine-5'-phosphate glycosidase